MSVAISRLTYQERKELNRCTERGCSRKASEDSALCRRHLRAARRRDREYKQRRRDGRRADKLCIWCPGSKPARATEGSSSCLPCRTRRNRIKISDGGGDGGVYDNRDARIAAATRKDPDGRTRYFGQQKRGQQPKSQLNQQDLRHAREDFDGFSAGVQLIASPIAETWSRGERERIEVATATLGNKAVGRVDDILERLGHFRQRHGRRDEGK